MIILKTVTNYNGHTFPTFNKKIALFKLIKRDRLKLKLIGAYSRCIHSSQSGGDQNLFNSGIVMVEDVHKAAAGLAFEEEPTVETQEVE